MSGRGLTSALNLVLIGMPGCGKSTIGLAASRIMGRAFVDLDEEIEREAGMSIPDIFRREGEDAVRELEHAAAERAGRGEALVIASGGGTVKRADSMDELRRNGAAIWLTRPLALLAIDGRPLSTDMDALRRLEAERTPLYEKYAAARVSNEESIESAVRRAAKAFYEIAARG